MIVSASPGLNLTFHGTCIRFDDDETPLVPTIHHNEGHATVGVTGLEITPEGELQILLQSDEFGIPRKIVSMSAQFDESMCHLVAKGWSIGCSNGVGVALIRFVYTDPTTKVASTKKANHPALYGVNRNIWFSAITIAAADIPAGAVA